MNKVNKVIQKYSKRVRLTFGESDLQFFIKE
jgi:hypothetical protein